MRVSSHVRTRSNALLAVLAAFAIVFRPVTAKTAVVNSTGSLSPGTEPYFRL